MANEKTKNTNYVTSMLKSLRDFSRTVHEERHEESWGAPPNPEFSRFLGGHFSYVTYRKDGFSRLARFSRSGLSGCVHISVKMRARDEP